MIYDLLHVVLLLMDEFFLILDRLIP